MALKDISNEEFLRMAHKMPAKDMAEIFGVSTTRIYQRRAELGIVVRTHKYKRLFRSSPLKIEQMAKLYKTAEMTSTEIAEIAGVSPAHVRHGLIRFGVNLRSKGRRTV